MTPVPNEVLRKAVDVAEIIQTHVGSPATFCISDINVHPDPFLAFGVLPCEELFILAHWDEPGYSISGDHKIES